MSQSRMSWSDIPQDADPQTLINVLNDQPHLLLQLKHINEELADAVATKDVVKVRTVMMMQQLNASKDKWEKQQEILRLNAQPYDPEAQAKIEEQIRLQNVQDNMAIAMDEMPEAFGSVHMLYINCEVNNHPLKAFVDSGAQSTIMSEGCAQRCGIMRLVDKRFAGKAVGVGSANIVGRVHLAQIKIGSTFFGCTFTILENQSVDMLFGLDMLKRHRCCIDLGANCLRLEGGSGIEEVQFLPENEIPKNEFTANGSKDEKADNLKSDGGSSASSSSSSSSSSGGTGAGGGGGAATSTTTTTTNAGQKPPPVSPLTDRITGPGPGPGAGAIANTANSATMDTATGTASVSLDDKIAQLVGLGFSSEDASRALAQTKGDVNLAASMLFSSS